MKLARTCVCGRRIEPGSHCASCGPKPVKQKRMNPIYNDEAYKRNRVAAIERTAGRCGICGVQVAEQVRGTWRMGTRGGVHHVVRAQQGGHGVGNLVLLCTRCHHAEHTRARRQ